MRDVCTTSRRRGTSLTGGKPTLSAPNPRDTFPLLARANLPSQNQRPLTLGLSTSALKPPSGTTSERWSTRKPSSSASTRPRNSSAPSPNLSGRTSSRRRRTSRPLQNTQGGIPSRPTTSCCLDGGMRDWRACYANVCKRLCGGMKRRLDGLAWPGLSRRWAAAIHSGVHQQRGKGCSIQADHNRMLRHGGGCKESAREVGAWAGGGCLQLSSFCRRVSCLARRVPPKMKDDSSTYMDLNSTIPSADQYTDNTGSVATPSSCGIPPFSILQFPFSTPHPHPTFQSAIPATLVANVSSPVFPSR